MATDYTAIDLGKDTAPDLADLADEVHRTKRPRVLRRANEDIAVIFPIRKKPARSPLMTKSDSDMAAFLSSAGGWKDVDTDRLKADIYESRRLSTKSRPEL